MAIQWIYIGPMAAPRKPPPKRRKPAASRKEESIRLRLTTAQKDMFTKAAERAGLDLSGWLRHIATQEAERLSQQ